MTIILLGLYATRWVSTRFVFNGGEPSNADSFESLLKAEATEYPCSSLVQPVAKDVTLHFRFGYPLVSFDGLLFVADRKYADPHGIPRELYRGKFAREIRLHSVCFDASRPDGANMDLEFHFITPTRFYEWRMRKEYPILKHERIGITPRYNDTLSATIADVYPIR